MSAAKGGRVSPKSLERLERTERAVELRRRGFTYREIARELRVTLKAAHKLVTDAFKATQRHAREATEELKQLQDERLESMYRSLAARIEKGDARAIEVGIKLLERQSRLHGLDAPAKAETSVTFRHLSDAELLDEARRVKLDVRVLPGAGVLLPGEVSLPPLLEAEVVSLLSPPADLAGPSVPEGSVPPNPPEGHVP